MPVQRVMIQNANHGKGDSNRIGNHAQYLHFLSSKYLWISHHNVAMNPVCEGDNFMRNVVMRQRNSSRMEVLGRSTQ